jgi:hypothetical protein
VCRHSTVPGRMTSACSNVRARGLRVTRRSSVLGIEVSLTHRVRGPRKHVYFLYGRECEKEAGKRWAARGWGWCDGGIGGGWRGVFCSRASRVFNVEHTTVGCMEEWGLTQHSHYVLMPQTRNTAHAQKAHSAWSMSSALSTVWNGSEPSTISQ